MRKTTMVAAGLIATALAWSCAHAAMIEYKGTLSGAAEVPPVAGAGAGTAAVNLDPATMEITYTVTFSGLSGPAMAAHIHCGAAAGANAGVAVPLKGTASPITGSATMTGEQMAQLQAGKCYVNIHTAANKGGEVRAQLTQ